MDNIRNLSLGLIKAADISDFNKNSSNGSLYSIRFFGKTGEFIDDQFVINKDTSGEFKSIKDNVSSTLKKLNEMERKELLVELLSNELNI